MKVKNISHKVIGIGELVLLPDDIGEVPVKHESNPIINDYVEMSLIQITDATKTVIEGEEEVTEERTEADAAAAELKKAQLENLKNLTEEQIGALATQLGIDLASCKDSADVTRKIRAALKK